MKEVWNQTHEINSTKFKNTKNNTEIFVVNKDTLEQNVLLLNMADDLNPSGFVTQGSGAQDVVI